MIAVVAGVAHESRLDKVNTSEIFGLAASIVTLAMLSVAIVNGEKLAAIMTAGGNAFATSLEAATGRAL